MDNPWRAELYSPSSACEVAPYERLEPDLFENEKNEVLKFTREIADLPYDPELWLYRGRSLRLLGYPELALGDVYKARLLVEAALENNTALGGDALLSFGMKIWYMHMTDPAWERWRATISTPELLRSRVIDVLEKLEIQIWTELMEGLMASNACTDYLQLSQEAVAKFPTDAIFPSELANAKSWFKQREEILQAQNDAGEINADRMQSTLFNGGVYATAYPWMLEEVVSRDGQRIESIKAEFAVASTNCTLARSSIRDSQKDGQTSPEPDVLGVVALTNIGVNETVVIDSTVVGVTNSVNRCPTCCKNVIEGFTNSCCNASYCSEVCSQIALHNFHSALCCKDFQFLYDAAADAKVSTDLHLDALLIQRILSLAIHRGVHPLSLSILNRLTPAYGIDQLIIFNFSDHIITPIRVLQELGIDVFANPNFDTWIIHTIRCRLQNNKHEQNFEDVVGTAVHPLYSMFNHSCGPNVEWENEGDTSTLRMYAERPISKGEEMFISYIGQSDMKWAERQKALMPWLGMECECHRCKAERLSEE